MNRKEWRFYLRKNCADFLNKAEEANREGWANKEPLYIEVEDIIDMIQKEERRQKRIRNRLHEATIEASLRRPV